MSNTLVADQVDSMARKPVFDRGIVRDAVLLGFRMKPQSALYGAFFTPRSAIILVFASVITWKQIPKLRSWQR